MRAARRLLILFLAFIPILSAGAVSAARRNAANLLALWGLTGDSAALDQAMNAFAEDTSCRALWMMGLMSHARGNVEQRDVRWERFLACEPSGIPFVAAYLREDRAWAERVVRLFPDRAESWFWLAHLAERDDPALAAEAYRRGLEIAPYDGMRWQSYGFVLLRTAGEEAALQAFIRSCEMGGNGCRRVGAIMERRGDLETAIRYYRADRSPEFHRYADELERKMRNKDGGVP